MAARRSCDKVVFVSTVILQDFMSWGAAAYFIQLSASPRLLRIPEDLRASKLMG